MARPPITKLRPYTPRSGAFAGRTFHTEREYRNALAKLKGFTSWHEQQRAAKKVTPKSFGTLKPSQRQARARAIDAFSQTPVPASPKTTFNVGVIRGGTSVNSIPESASMRVDLRSTSTAEIDRLERALRLALDQAVASENRAAAQHGTRKPQVVQSEVVEIGNRPAGELAADARLLKVIRAVDVQLGNTAQVQRASTDANIPLSLGREAIAIGAGGSGGGAHTLQEWFDCNGRDLGLKRILLTMLTLSGTGE